MTLHNPVKERLTKGLPTVGQWVSMPVPSIVELLSSFQMDWLCLDTEHGPADTERVEDMIRALKGTDVVPIVRVGGNDPVLIKRALDRGALGVIVPLVNTPEQARAAVAASKYPPEGIRGVAGTRVNRFGMDLGDYFTQWNGQVVVICQIETVEALENVEAIAAVPGVDVLFIGPNDLSAALNGFRQFDRPEFKSAVDRIVKATKRHGSAAGYMASSTEEVLERIDQGFRFVSNGTDARMLAVAAAASYAKIKAGLAERIPAYRIASGD
jgi:2-keto-3-deoxy-L-rhamnonate aldolase RhmA